MCGQVADFRTVLFYRPYGLDGVICIECEMAWNWWLEGLKVPLPRCQGLTHGGEQCQSFAITGTSFCPVHRPPDDPKRCQHDMGYRYQCRQTAHNGSQYCKHHLGITKVKLEAQASREDVEVSILDNNGDGEIDYHEYIASDEWAARSKEAKEDAKWRCQVCNGSGVLHTHHRTYDNLGEEEPEDLIVLCASCHKLFHDNGRLRR